MHTHPVSTKVTYITQESIKGWIPGLTKKSLARKPLIIASIDTYLRKKADRLKLQQQQQQQQRAPSPPKIPSINIQQDASSVTSSPILKSHSTITNNNTSSLVTPSISITKYVYYI